MQLSLFTDEVDQQAEAFIPFFRQRKIHFAEIRMFNGLRVPEHGERKTRAMAKLLRQHDLEVSAVSPGLFKAPAEKGLEAMEVGLREKLPRAIEAATIFSCQRLILFSPHRPAGKPGDGAPPDWLREGLYQAGEMAAAAGLCFCLENEPGTWADTGANTSRLLQMIDNPFLRANWDPANAIFSGNSSPWPGDYQELAPLVEHVHVKDALSAIDDEGARFVPLGDGEMDWPNQLHSLAQANYQGFLTVETHCEPLAETTPRSLNYLQELLRDPQLQSGNQ